jgi:hypothetical protein
VKRLGKKLGGGKEAGGSPPPTGQGHPPPPWDRPAPPPRNQAPPPPPSTPYWAQQAQDSAGPAPAPPPTQQAAPPPPAQQRAAPPPPPRYQPPAPPPGGGGEKSLGEIVSEVSEKGALLVREEIELAKAEMVQKAKTLARGAGIGAAAAVFLSFAAVMLLHTLAWFLVDLFDLSIWVGFGLVTLLLVILGVVAGLLARKWLGTGPPTPNMAIQEARTTRQTLEHQQVQRDQLQRGQQPPWRVNA